MKNLSLMIKPASSLCNLECRYCFYRDLAGERAVASYGLMTRETIEKIVRRVCEEVTDEAQFFFQGGEPMLAGLEFYRAFEEAVARHAPKRLHVERAIQTNGTRIDGEWAAFFKQHGYLAGISLDGMAELQNDLRPTAGGGGSFSQVMAGIRCLEKEQVPYNILTVVSEPVARRGGAVYRFLRKNGWNYLQFIPCIDPIGGGGADYSLRPATYAKFLKNTFDLYFEELSRGVPVSVRWFDNVVDLLRGMPPESCGVSGECACQLVLEADGSAYPCDFYVHEDYALGNAADEPLEKLLTAQNGRRFVEESRFLPEECRACPVYPVCRNGCRRYRAPYLGAQPGKNALCEAYREFFAYAGERLAFLARVRR